MMMAGMKNNSKFSKWYVKNVPKPSPEHSEIYILLFVWTRKGRWGDFNAYVESFAIIVAPCQLKLFLTNVQ